MGEENDALKAMGIRLGSERERLGLTQAQLAEKCGLTREMWGRYERGQTRLRPAYIQRLMELGIDCEFIESGIRSAELASFISSPNSKTKLLEAISLVQEALNIAEAPDLSDEDKIVLNAFRNASPEIRQVFLALAKNEDKRHSA